MKFGGTVTFRVEVDSIPLPSYQWQRVYGNDSFHGIPGADNALQIMSIQSQDLGQYQVRALNSYGNLELIFTLVEEGE